MSNSEKNIPNINYSTVIIDLGSGLIKAGFGGEDGPRCIFRSVVGIPKKPGILVGMEEKERFIGNEAIEKVEMMDFVSPIKRGVVEQWEKFETLIHYLFYSQLKIVPEEASILVTECPLTSKENRQKLAELMFETFNVEKLHIANSSMLALYSYGKSTGLVVDSGYNVTSSVPIYEGYPLTHASKKLNIGGEDISKTLLEYIKERVGPSYKGMKGLMLADRIKEEKGFIYLEKEIEDAEILEEKYTLPDGKIIELSSEVYKHCEELFNSSDGTRLSIQNSVLESASCCDNDIKTTIKGNVCLSGGTTLLKNFGDKLRLELSNSADNIPYKVESIEERQFSAWIGGSIVSSLENFQYMWVKKEDYDKGKLDAIDSKCF